MYQASIQISHKTRVACFDAIEAAEASHIPRNSLCQLFDIVLRYNVFSFNGRIYQQIQGTVMGTKMAPSYANLFMYRFEQEFCLLSGGFTQMTSYAFGQVLWHASKNKEVGPSIPPHCWEIA